MWPTQNAKEPKANAVPTSRALMLRQRRGREEFGLLAANKGRERREGEG